MEVKVLEIRDSATFFGMLCINMNPDNPAQRYLMRRVGYPCNGKPNIAVCHVRCSNDPITNDPYQHGGRTYPVAHNYIIENWTALRDGDVIDVEFILGETKTKKQSERFEYGDDQ